MLELPQVRVPGDDQGFSQLPFYLQGTTLNECDSTDFIFLDQGQPNSSKIFKRTFEDNRVTKYKSMDRMIAKTTSVFKIPARVIVWVTNFHLMFYASYVQSDNYCFIIN